MNPLHFGDNLHILRENILDATVDLRDLDPPFNSQRDDNCGRSPACSAAGSEPSIPSS